MLGSLGFGELMIIMFIVLLLFGAKRLPELARSLGKGISEFKKGMNSTISEIQETLESTKPEITSSASGARKSGKTLNEKKKTAKMETTEYQKGGTLK